ncbi:MAG: hypothetical protein RML38_11750, partial [Bacteroidia bacterium]|nr:hypothetical protein [Bacteroidia bacterium]
NAHPPHASRKRSLKQPFLCFLCKVLACKYLYFNFKQGKDITAQVNCVRGMEHAVRQCVSTEAKRSAECPDPCVSKGHAQKNKINFLKICTYQTQKDQITAQLLFCKKPTCHNLLTIKKV